MIEDKNMNEKSKRIEELFRLGVVVPRAERAGFLKRHCGGDESLERELAALLSQDDEGTKEYLASPILSRWSKSDTSRAEDPAATEEVLHGNRTERIGRYRILHELGEGGMGAVYLAEQSEPVKRRVALKVVKLGMDTRRVVARFDRERQALAMMDHPCIARIFDGGTTESGRPYFVMEYVPGAPITDYCDDNGLDVHERLDLFVKVCEAVQHAHKKGIIHRDLKPSNVLVAQREGKADPKVIDFGIARATEGADGTSPRDDRATRATEIIGTYAYMSPEQADPNVENIDSRSDVYALGVMLYELLTGTLPVDLDLLRGKSPAEVSKTLFDTDPLSPSTKLGRLGSSSTHIADCRGGLEPRALAKKLTGDLDWIALRAMERDPERRYPSAAALANDIRRHLTHQPVVAGPPSAAYRMRKFVRRRRVGVTAAAAIVLTVASGATGTILGFTEASGEARIARAAETKARVALAMEAERREHLESYNDTLLDLVDLSDPEAPLRSDESAVSLLTDLRKHVTEIFADDPRGEAKVRVRLGRALRSRGELELAREDLERAQALQEKAQAPVPERLETVRELHNLAVDTGGYADYTAGLSAISLEVELLSEIDKDAGAAAAALLKSAVNHDVDGIDENLAALEKSLPSSSSQASRGPRLLAADMLGLTGGYLGLHFAFGEAEPLLMKSLTMLEEIHGPTHPEVVGALDVVTLHLHQQGRSRVATQILNARTAAFHERFSADHWLRAEVDSLLGECLSLQGGADDRALALLQSSHATILKDRGPHSRVAVHAALRLREHYTRSQDALIPTELDSALGSTLALSRDPGGAWLRTAKTLGADENVTAALTELFTTSDPHQAMGPRSTRAADVLATIIATRGEAGELGDLVARAIVAAKPQMRGGDHALVNTWSDVIDLAEVRNAEVLLRREMEKARVADSKPRADVGPAADFLPAATGSGSSDTKGPAGTDHDPAQAISTDELTTVEIEEDLSTIGGDPEEIEPTAEQLLLFAWTVAADAQSDPEHYALALEASELALALAPDKDNYGVVKALALARVGASQAALDELYAIEQSIGEIGLMGWCAKALAYDMQDQEKLAQQAVIMAELHAFYFPGSLPPGTIQLILELERRLRD